MTVAGDLCIFRMGDSAPAGSHEDSPTTEVVQFGDGATTPDSLSNFEAISPRFGRMDSHNPAPTLDQARLPDVGYSGPQVVVRAGFSRDTSDVRRPWGAGYRRLCEWTRTSGDIKKTYPHGRYGLRADWMPEADCEPDATAGYKLHSIEPAWESEYHGSMIAVITLRFDGAASRLDTGWKRQVSSRGVVSYTRGAKGAR